MTDMDIVCLSLRYWLRVVGDTTYPFVDFRAWKEQQDPRTAEVSALVTHDLSLWCPRLIDLHRRINEITKHARAIEDILMDRDIEKKQNPAAAG